MGLFFIDTSTGQVATQHQLIDAGITDGDGIPPRPWLRIQGTRRRVDHVVRGAAAAERGIFIGTLALRHGDHHASLLERGWEEIPVDEIGVSAA